jgi:hypothetical protein
MRSLRLSVWSSRVDWVFLGGWMLLGFYVLGFWTNDHLPLALQAL